MIETIWARVRMIYLLKVVKIHPIELVCVFMNRERSGFVFAYLLTYSHESLVCDGRMSRYVTDRGTISTHRLIRVVEYARIQQDHDLVHDAK